MNTVPLTLWNILINAIYYAITAVLGPAAVLFIEAAAGHARHESSGLRAMGIVLGTAGIVLQAWCIVLFQRVGRGTPSPALPTVHFVDRGPYRWVRNPLNLGEVLVLLALAAWFGSGGLLVYVLVAWSAFHAFIVLREEPRHAKLFGAAYLRYQATVNRWLPRPPAASRGPEHAGLDSGS